MSYSGLVGGWREASWSLGAITKRTLDGTILIFPSLQILGLMKLFWCCLTLVGWFSQFVAASLAKLTLIGWRWTLWGSPSARIVFHCLLQIILHQVQCTYISINLIYLFIQAFFAGELLSADVEYFHYSNSYIQQGFFYELLGPGRWMEGGFVVVRGHHKKIS